MKDSGKYMDSRAMILARVGEWFDVASARIAENEEEPAADVSLTIQIRDDGPDSDGVVHIGARFTEKYVTTDSGRALGTYRDPES